MAQAIPAAIIFGVAVATASCVAAPYDQKYDQRTRAELSRALAGRVAGRPVNCIPNYRTTNMRIIDDYTILFDEGRTVYVQKPRGGCRGIHSGSYTLVTRPLGVSQLCSGDINQLVDLRTGMTGGSCVFGPYIPYTKAAG